MKILVINSGSSSLKFELIDMTNEKTIAKGICERVGIASPLFTFKNLVKDIVIKDKPVNMTDHRVAINTVLEALQDKETGVIDSVDEIDAIGHRMVHGGEYFSDSTLVDEKALELFEECSSLAPLHNPANIMGIKVMKELLPTKQNVAVFDTAFHQTMKPEAFMYALPYEDYKELKVRKYGFHGTSHKYVSEVTSELLGKKDAKIIVCHLGNGASLSAVEDGKVVDTSMGLTPLPGVMMGTRSGDVDPAVPFYVMQKRALSVEEMENRMNKKSGILGIFGDSSDFRDLENAMDSGNERAKLAYDMFCYRVRLYIGSYVAAMDGVDAIAFTGGIGENGDRVRASICKNLNYLGIEFDEEINSKRISGHVELTKPTSKVKVFKVETAEELVIARDTYRLVK